MIVALEEAKRKLGELHGIVRELGNQLRIEEARERAAELERETMVQDFWNDAEKSSKKLQAPSMKLRSLPRRELTSSFPSISSLTICLLQSTTALTSVTVSVRLMISTISAIVA